MSHDERTEALPTDDSTVHLGATLRIPGQEPTVNLAGPGPGERSQEPTVHLDGGAPTVRVPAEEPTAHLFGAGATVHLPGRGPGAEPTVHLAVPDPVRSGDATVHLAANAPTARVPREAPTEHFAAGAATEHFAAGAATGTTAARTTDAGRPTGRFTPTAAGTRPGGATAAAGPGGEVRFGPGVPSAPPPVVPAWRPVAPARRRSVWRRAGSLLSGLLTVALLVVVGLYLWQRLSPLEIESVSVAVPEPPGQSCDVTVRVVATVRTNGNAGEIRYQWLRSDSEPTALLTERVGRGQRTVTLPLSWSFSGVGTTTETATVNIVDPTSTQARTTLTYSCPRG